MFEKTHINSPLLVKVHPHDNVAVVVDENGMEAGTRLQDGLTAKEFIPQGHKISLVDLLMRQEIKKYGEVIGYAAKDISVGNWIREDMVIAPGPIALETLEFGTQLNWMPPLEGYTFLGYKNENGTVGTKNMLGFMSSVQCVEGVLNIAVERIKKELLPKYSNVDGVAAINHDYGCGVAIDAPEARIPITTLQNIAENPNFGEMIVVTLGCEKLVADNVFRGAKDKKIVLQQQDGFLDMVEAIMGKAEQSLQRLNKRRRQTCHASELVVGLQCGGSDAFSGITSNPAVGYAADLLVRCGATVIFSEVSEVRDGLHLLGPRVVNNMVGEKLLEQIRWYDRYLDMGQVDRSANPAPGNKAGGLANVVEKSLGSIAKSGTSPIVDVTGPGEKVKKQGLVFAATPASDFVCGTLQLAAGITMQVFTTGRGTPYGLAVAPVIKVSTRTSLMKKWPDLIDLDAGSIVSGEEDIEAVGKRIFQLILSIASGNEKTKADHWGIENRLCLFNPAPIT